MEYKTKLAVVILAIATSCAHAEVTTDVICSYAPSQSAAVNRIGSAISGAAVGSEVTLWASAMTIVPHSSGLPILTGAGGYIAGSMTGALVATTMITVGLVVGGTVITVELACAPKNHPALVKKIIESADNEYLNLVDKARNAGNSDMLDKARAIAIKIKHTSEDMFYELIDEPWYKRTIRKTKRIMGVS